MNYLQIGSQYINLDLCVDVVIFRHYPDVVFYMVDGREFRFTKLSQSEKDKIREIILS